MIIVLPPVALPGNAGENLALMIKIKRTGLKTPVHIIKVFGLIKMFKARVRSRKNQSSIPLT